MGFLRPRVHRRPSLLASVVALILAAGAGIAAGASFQVVHSTIRANGNYVAATDLAPWWNETLLATTAIPSAVPGAASSAVGAPSVLPAGAANYTIDTAAAGKAALVWAVEETAAAPNSTEIELTFNISLSDTSTVQITVYLETASSPPAADATIRLFYQLPTLAITTTVVQSVAEVSQLCTSVGTCP